jgi:demethylmenaquinone methyltransferase/2-methoxy-6-polyprenyl-1,4-benzoquinol methylase
VEGQESTVQADPSRDPRQVRHMFAAVARRYDLLNRVLSGSLDRRWRRAAARELPGEGVGLALDLCGGTGDLTLELVRSGRARRAICCDFAHPMLLRAGQKLERDGTRDRCQVVEAGSPRSTSRT